MTGDCRGISNQQGMPSHMKILLEELKTITETNILTLCFFTFFEIMLFVAVFIYFTHDHVQKLSSDFLFSIKCWYC